MNCFEKVRGSIEKCEIERDEELRQANRDCEAVEIRENEKMKGMRQNLFEKNESKQIKSRKEGDIQKKKTKFDKSAIIRFNEMSPDRKISVKTVCDN